MGYNFITIRPNLATNQNLAKIISAVYYITDLQQQLQTTKQISLREGANMPQFSLCIHTHSRAEHFSL